MDNIERLPIDFKHDLTGISESLKRDIQGLHKRFDELGARFDAQAMRLDRQAALLEICNRQTNRRSVWPEKE